MKESYKCCNCDLWYEEKDIDHISYSSDEKGMLLIWIACKRCKERFNKK